MSYRLLITFSLIGVIIFFPYWIYVPALILAMAALPLYWESILLGFLINILYGEKWHDLYSIILSPGFLALAGLLMLIPLRRRLRSHV